jgi:hypothetical protein
MDYANKKIMIKWLAYPLIIFSFIPFINNENIYPSLIPLVIGGVIMIPMLLRRYFIWFAGLMLVAGGISVFNPVYTSGGYRIFGVENIHFTRKNINNLMISLKEDINLDGVVKKVVKKSDSVIKTIGVYTDNQYINFYTLNSIKNNYNLTDVRFTNYIPQAFNFLDYLIIDENNIRYVDTDVFTEVIKIKDIHLLRKKAGDLIDINNISEYKIPVIKIGKLVMNDVKISPENYNSQTGTADYAVMTSNYTNFDGIDIYALKLKLNYPEFSKSSPFFITGFSSIELLDSKISDFSFSRFVEDKFGGKLSVEFLDDIIKINSNNFWNDLSIYGILTVNKNEINFSVNYLKYGYIKIPGFICSFLNFRFDLNKYSIPLKINNIKINQGIIGLK